MKVIVQLLEVGIGLTVALFLGGKFLRLFELGIFEPFKVVMNNFANLIGFTQADLFVKFLIGILIVMSARWIISFISNNGGQTPNNNGN